MYRMLRCLSHNLQGMSLCVYIRPQDQGRSLFISTCMEVSIMILSAPFDLT